MLRTIITRVPKVRQANVFDFPRYTASNAVFDAARTDVAAFIESHQQ